MVKRSGEAWEVTIEADGRSQGGRYTCSKTLCDRGGLRLGMEGQLQILGSPDGPDATPQRGGSDTAGQLENEVLLFPR